MKEKCIKKFLKRKSDKEKSSNDPKHRYTCQFEEFRVAKQCKSPGEINIRSR